MYVADYDVMKLVDEIQKENGTISEVYFVACGGSLIDLYSSNYFVNRESASMIADTSQTSGQRFSCLYLFPWREYERDGRGCGCGNRGGGICDLIHP